MSLESEEGLKMSEETNLVRVVDAKQSDDYDVPSCRICLTKTNETESIFNTIDTITKTKLSDLVMIVSPICIGLEDNLPRNICKSCKHNLIVAYEFRELSIKSDRVLKSGIETTVGILKCDLANTVKCEQDTENYETIYEVKEIVEKEDEEPDPTEEDEEMLMAEVEEGELIEMNSETGHPCEVCNKIFKSMTKLSRHASVHSLEGRPFQCDSCSYRFPTEAGLQRHISLNHNRNTDAKKSKTGRKQHICPICNKIFDKAYRLLRHSNVHNPEGKPYECEICYQRFATEIACARHQIIHSGILEKMTTQTGVVQIKCLICAKVFPKKESLSSHMKTHKEELATRTFQCEYCPRTFTKMSLLTRHSKTHAEKKIHECNICGKTFSQAGPLIDHLNTHRGLKQHVCEICNKSFQQACTLRDHLRVHSGEQPYLCSECGKAFNNGSNLRQHLMRHTGQKPFACNQCPSRFTCKAGLNSHIQTHTGVKPYVCDECGSSFTKPYSLSKHKRIHTGEKPYPCETCSMRFNSSDHLKRHKRTHTGEKPYKCKFCERAFTQSNDLVKHLRSHVGDNTYSCDKCNAAFRLHGELKVHIQTHFLEEKQKMSGGTGGESCSSNDGMIVVKNSDNTDKVPNVVIKLESNIAGNDE